MDTALLCWCNCSPHSGQYPERNRTSHQLVPFSCSPAVFPACSPHVPGTERNTMAFSCFLSVVLLPDPSLMTMHKGQTRHLFFLRTEMMACVLWARPSECSETWGVFLVVCLCGSPVASPHLPGDTEALGGVRRFHMQRLERKSRAVSQELVVTIPLHSYTQARCPSSCRFLPNLGVST